jgi:hypothetical protein
MAQPDPVNIITRARVRWRWLLVAPLVITRAANFIFLAEFRSWLSTSVHFYCT